MLKHIIKYGISSLLLAGALLSCGKNADEPMPEVAANEPQLGVELGINAIEPLDDNLRLASYDLVGEKKKMEINFLHIKEATEAQMRRSKVTNADNFNKMPVHLFFINTKLGITSRRYYLRYMEITGEKSLYLPFQDYPGVRALFRDDNADYWYVKAFIGGIVNSRNDKLGSEIFFMMDNLFSCDPSETSYMTQTIDQNFGPNKWQIPMPFPMESPWLKVNFFFNGSPDAGTLTDTKAGNYPNTLQTFEIKPLGALMRLQLHNQRTKDLPVTVFHFSPAPDRGGSRVNKNDSPNPDAAMVGEQIYVNSITRKIDVMPPLDANRYITNDALTEPLPGATTQINRDGDVHYHSKKFETPIGYSNHEVVYIKAGSSRTFFFWLFEDHINNTNKQDAYVMPFFHNTYNSNNLINGRHGQGTTVPNGSTTVPYKPIYLGSTNNDHCIIVRRGQYENGKTYFIKSTLRNKQ